MPKEITVIEKEVSPVTEKANQLTIKNQQTMTEAVTLLSQLNQQLDKITKEKEKVTKPLNEALKAERNRWKPIETILEEAINEVRTKMSEYQTEQTRKAHEEQEKIAARLTKGTLSIKTAVNKLDAIEHPDQSVETDNGLVKFRTVQSLKIVDESLIPREYLQIDEVAIKTALKAGIAVPGAILEAKQVPANYR